MANLNESEVESKGNLNETSEPGTGLHAPFPTPSVAKDSFQKLQLVQDC